jgi:hypothetical protein
MLKKEKLKKINNNFDLYSLTANRTNFHFCYFYQYMRHRIRKMYIQKVRCTQTVTSCFTVMPISLDVEWCAHSSKEIN